MRLLVRVARVVELAELLVADAEVVPRRRVRRVDLDRLSRQRSVASFQRPFCATSMPKLDLRLGVVALIGAAPVRDSARRPAPQPARTRVRHGLSRLNYTAVSGAGVPRIREISAGPMADFCKPAAGVRLAESAIVGDCRAIGRDVAWHGQCTARGLVTARSDAPRRSSTLRGHLAAAARRRHRAAPRVRQGAAPDCRAAARLLATSALAVCDGPGDAARPAIRRARARGRAARSARAQPRAAGHRARSVDAGLSRRCCGTSPIRRSCSGCAATRRCCRRPAVAVVGSRDATPAGA